MAESSSRPAKDPNSETSTTPICDLLKLLSCCVNTSECHHDTNPWSDSDPELQLFSTAALEALQEHAAHRMKSLLHMHEVLDKEIANRKLESRFNASITSKSDNQPAEILFNNDDFEPLIALLGAQDNISGPVTACPEGEQRDAIAKMCISWISEAREAARQSRRNAGTKRPASVKHRSEDEVAAIVDVEGAEDGSFTFQDVEALEDEMEGYD